MAIPWFRAAVSSVLSMALNTRRRPAITSGGIEAARGEELMTFMTVIASWNL